MPGLRQHFCNGKNCGALVIFAVNVRTGRRLVLDAQSVPDGKLRPGDAGVLGEKAKTLRKADLDGGRLTTQTREKLREGVTFHRPHWGICPDRRSFA